MADAMALDAVWLDVLPSMARFGPELAKGAQAAADKEGKGVGRRFGTAMIAGVAVVAGGAALATRALYGIGETFDTVVDTIRVGTGATGAALDDLTESAKRVGTTVPAEYEAIGTVVADVNTRLGLTGPTLEKLSSQILEAGRILGEEVDINAVSASFNAFKIEGEDTTAAMDHLYRVSQATGVGINELASNVSTSAPAVQALGFSFEETAGLVGSLDKAGLNSSKMMAGMSRALVELAKDGEEPADAFRRTTSEIQGFLDKGDKAAAIDLASQLFGTRNASQFIGALESGALAMDDLAAVAGMTEDTILDAGRETMDFAEQWQIFKNRVLVFLEPLAARVFGAFGAGMAWLNDTGVPILKGFADWLGPKLQRPLAWIRDVGSRVFDEIAGAVTAFGAAWTYNDGEVTSSGLPGVLERVGYFARQAFDYISSTALPALQGFVQGFRDGEGPGGTLRTVLDGVWTVAKDLFGFVTDTALPALQDFAQGFRDGEGPGGALRAALEGVWDAGKQVFDYINNTALPALSSLYDFLKDNEEILLAVGAAVLAYQGYLVLMNVWTKAVTIATTIWTGVQKALNAVLRLNPIGLLIAALAALVAVVIYAYNENETFRAVVDRAWAGIKAAIDAVVQWFVTVAWPWLQDVFARLGAVVMWLWDTIVKPYFELIWGLLKSVGSWVKETLWPWMRDAFSNIADRAGSLKDKAVDAFDRIRAGISTAWDGAKKILDKFKAGLSDLRERFSSVKDGIASTWGTLTSAIASPIRSVVQFVNDKFLGPLEKALRLIPGNGSMSLPRIPVPDLPARQGTAAQATYGQSYGPGTGGYAAGGLIQGPWRGPAADNVLGVSDAGVPVARVNPLEWVTRVSSTMAMRRNFPGWLEHINEYGRPPGFAGGGLVGARRQTGGAVGDALSGAGSFLLDLFRDARGAVGSLVDRLLTGIGESVPGRVVVGAAKSTVGGIVDWVKEKFFGGADGPEGISGPVGPAMGWRALWGLVKGLYPDAILTSAVRNTRIAGTNIRSLHADGRAIDFALNPWSRMVEATRTLSQVRRWTELIHTPAGSWQQNRGVNTANFPQLTRDMHHDHVHLGMNTGGQVPALAGGLVRPFVADSGALLQPGWNLLDNQTGGTEPLGRLDKELDLSADTIDAILSGMETLLREGNRDLVNELVTAGRRRGGGGA